MTNFFIFCSGVYPSFLKRSPSEIQKYVGIGATIFFTGLLAFIASSYAFYTVFNSYTFACMLGLVWGLMIFNLDRYIVSSMSKSGSMIRQWVMATPRLLFAILIALVISKPIEMKLFQSEIENEMVGMEQQAYQVQEKLLTDRFLERANEIAHQKSQILSHANLLRERRDYLVGEAMAEADGTGGSGIKNLGPIYRTKKQQADQAALEYQQFSNDSEKELSAIAFREREVAQDKMTALDNLEKVNLNGFASRLKALHLAGKKESAIALASLFITLLFIALETAPIFVKLIASKGPVDYVQAKHFFQYRDSYNQFINKESMEASYFEKTGNFALKKAIEQENLLIGETLKAEAERYQKEGLSWETIRHWRNSIAEIIFFLKKQT